MTSMIKTGNIEIPVDGHKLDIPIEPSVRTPEEMKDYAFDPSSLAGVTEPLYYMYRNVWSLDIELDRLCVKHMLRYDITVILPGLMGKEYYKTIGHFHPIIKGKNVTYPELYEVLSGDGLFIAQDVKCTEFQIIEAKKGDHVLVPYNHGHVTINPGKEPLIIGNLVASNFESEYDLVKEKHGLAYYLLEDGLVKNPHYKTHPPATRRHATPGPSLDIVFQNDPRHYENMLR